MLQRWRVTTKRSQDLQRRFRGLEALLPDGSEKEAFRVLNGLLQETRWELRSGAAGESRVHRMGPDSLEAIRYLCRSAPPMEESGECDGLRVGTPAPEFSLPDANNRQVRVSHSRGRPVVLILYPLDWSPGCSRQLGLYESEGSEFERFHAQLSAVSGDSIYSRGAWATVREISFPLLADFHPHGQVAVRYHLLRSSDGFSERALYVIDGEGVIRYARVSPTFIMFPASRSCSMYPRASAM